MIKWRIHHANQLYQRREFQVYFVPSAQNLKITNKRGTKLVLTARKFVTKMTVRGEKDS